MIKSSIFLRTHEIGEMFSPFTWIWISDRESDIVMFREGGVGWTW